MGYLRRLDDRVIGQAERDPAAHRRVDAWATALLLLIGGAIAIAFYLSDHGSWVRYPGMYVLIGVVVVGALLRFRRSRRR